MEGFSNMIKTLCLVLMLYSADTIDPQTSVNFTELLLKVNSLKATVSNVSQELHIEKMARQELDHKLNETKTALYSSLRLLNYSIHGKYTGQQKKGYKVICLFFL